MRLGAFEVQVFKREGGKNIEKVLHSKLQTGCWPTVSYILEKVHFYQQKVPKLVIQLYRDKNPGSIDSDSDDPYFKDI